MILIPSLPKDMTNRNAVRRKTFKRVSIVLAFLVGSVAYLSLLEAAGARLAVVDAGDAGGTTYITGGGAANYLPVFNAATSVISSIVYQTAGKVGIGTTNPQATLDVAGGVKVGDDPSTCISAKAGTLRWRNNSKLQVCDGTDWRGLIPVDRRSCKAILATGGGNSDGIYTIEPTPGTQYTAYCDMTTDGGGWTLVLAYKHLGGQNNPLVIGTVPQDPTIDYSHMSVSQIQQLSFTDARFYCETSGQPRKIHFKTSVPGVIDWIRGAGGNDVMYWTSGFTPLVNHTGFLPAATNNVGYSKPGNLALTEYPFITTGTYHWGVYGQGSRWECDDTDGPTNTTLHQVWVR